MIECGLHPAASAIWDVAKKLLSVISQFLWQKKADFEPFCAWLVADGVEGDVVGCNYMAFDGG